MKEKNINKITGRISNRKIYNDWIHLKNGIEIPNE